MLHYKLPALYEILLKLLSYKQFLLSMYIQYKYCANTHILTHAVRYRTVCFLKRHCRRWVSIRQADQSDRMALCLSYILQVVNSRRHCYDNTQYTVYLVNRTWQ